MVQDRDHADVVGEAEFDLFTVPEVFPVNGDVEQAVLPFAVGHAVYHVLHAAAIDFPERHDALGPPLRHFLQEGLHVIGERLPKFAFLVFGVELFPADAVTPGGEHEPVAIPDQTYPAVLPVNFLGDDDHLAGLQNVREVPHVLDAGVLVERGGLGGTVPVHGLRRRLVLGDSVVGGHVVSDRPLRIFDRRNEPERVDLLQFGDADSAALGTNAELVFRERLEVGGDAPLLGHVGLENTVRWDVDDLVALFDVGGRDDLPPFDVYDFEAGDFRVRVFLHLLNLAHFDDETRHTTPSVVGRLTVMPAAESRKGRNERAGGSPRLLDLFGYCTISTPSRSGLSLRSTSGAFPPLLSVSGF